MHTFKEGFKEYRKTTRDVIIRFIREEKRRVSPDTLGDYETLTPFDLRQELIFLIYLNDTPVGFCCIKIIDGNSRRLTKIYVTPTARKHGCGSHILRELKVTQVVIPIRCIQFISLCRAVGFFYNTRQNYPDSVAELTRHLSGS
jgi:GNAT superfamily N-acetyltransferase